MLNKRLFFILACLLLSMSALSACDLLPGGEEAAPKPLVALPTTGTGAPPPATRVPGTQLPQNTRAPTPTTDPNFWSNGNWIQGWWWLRDTAYQSTAHWIIDIPTGAGDITLDLTVLATSAANGGRGSSAIFFLTFGQPAGSGQEGTVYGHKMVALPNTSPASDPVGYTCTGTFTLTRAEIKNASRLWLKAGRKDELGGVPPVYRSPGVQ